MQLSKLWNKRLPDSAIDELTVRLEKIESDRGTVPPDDEQIGKIQRRLEKIESDLSSSWALRPREEYEKRVLGGMKHEIKEYLAKVAAATFIFLAPLPKV